MSVSDKDDNKSGSGGSRWWEYYFVRYFVGTVVGCGIVIFLNTSCDSSLYGLLLPGFTNFQDLKEFGAEAPILIGAIGLAYCYLASAPVLVLHATRGVFMHQDTKSLSGFLAGVALMGLLTFFAWVFHGVPRNCLGWSLLILTVLTQFVLLYFAFKNKADRVGKYYDELATARSEKTAVLREYKESYKHLREHGNAFLIIVFEFIFAMLALAFTDPSLTLVAIVIWASPAASVWFLGSILESRMIPEHTSDTSKH